MRNSFKNRTKHFGFHRYIYVVTPTCKCWEDIGEGIVEPQKNLSKVHYLNVISKWINDKCRIVLHILPLSGRSIADGSSLAEGISVIILLVIDDGSTLSSR